MANLKLKNPSGGSLALVSADGASDLTVTFPAATGTAMVSGNMPAFRATSSGNQSISAGTWTKIQFNNETFDAGGYYDNVTNYRFTPLVAGYYQVVCSVQYAGTTTTGNFTDSGIFKNGTLYQESVAVAGQYAEPCVSALVYLNGSTDYIEGYAQQNVGAGQTMAGVAFSAVLVRGA